MHLWSRVLQTQGPQQEIMGWAADMTAFVNQKTGAEVSLWGAMFGAPLGSFGWSMRVDGLSGLQAITGSLLEDADYHAKVGAAADWVAAPPEDTLLRPLNGELGDPPPVGSLALITRAIVTGGKYVEAITWGSEVAAHVESVTGMPVRLLMNEHGTFGELFWIGGAPDAAASDAASNALAADETYLGMLGAVGDLFVPGSGHRTQLARLA